MGPPPMEDPNMMDSKPRMRPVADHHHPADGVYLETHEHPHAGWTPHPPHSEIVMNSSPLRNSKRIKTEDNRPALMRVQFLEPTSVENFEAFLFAILSFKQANGTYLVPREQHPSLHAWMNHLKREYARYIRHPNSTRLEKEHFDVLESLHIPLTSRGDEHWLRFYNLLCQFKDKHGHCLVPRISEIPGLGDWVTDQRRQYKILKSGKPSQLNQERIDKLEAIGFVWAVRNRPEWDRRFQELCEYRAKYGDTKVPQHYRENKGLGKWVAKQREQYKNRQKGKHSFLTPDRLEKLESIGFIWQVRNAVPTDEDEHVVDAQHHHVVNHAHAGVAHPPGPPLPPIHHHHHHHHLPL